LKARKQADQGEMPTVRPLTRCNAEGRLYERLPKVQREIEAVMGLGIEELLALADTLNDETLVYLIRERRRAQEWSEACLLSEVLLKRCRAMLNSNLLGLIPLVRDEVIERVISQLFSKICTLEDDRGDFLQVRFGRALRRLRETSFQQCAYTLAQHALEQADSSTSPFDPQQWPEDKMAFSEAVDGLYAIKDEHHRLAYALRYVVEMPVESEDPDVPTISQELKVSPRTVRNWLKQAEDQIATWRRGLS